MHLLCHLFDSVGNTTWQSPDLFIADPTWKFYVVVLSFSLHSHQLPLFLMKPLWITFSVFCFFTCPPPPVEAISAFYCKIFFLFLLNLCVFSLLPHSVCMFLFTERTKECVWWGDIGCIGAPRAQEETQMCAAMRGSYLSKAHTPFTHAYTHTHRNTHVFKYIHPCLSQTPLPCSAKAAWQHCFPCGRLGRKQPTKFQIILCNNNNQASPLRLSSG